MTNSPEPWDDAVFHLYSRRKRWRLDQAQIYRDHWAHLVPLLSSEDRELLKQCQRSWSKWRWSGCRYLSSREAGFPVLLQQIPGRPLGLFYRGAVEVFQRPQLAIVGSREPSEISLNWISRETRAFLMENPQAVIVSGGARGVDFAAHRACLFAARPTIVFLPSGLMQIYPRQHESFITEVLNAGGLVVSEYAPEEGMQKAFFAERNRLISGVSAGVLLVEARVRSGTLLTAQAAVDQSRPVFVVPSHPYDANSQGGLRLLAEGAVLVQNAQDLSLYFQAEVRNSAAIQNPISSDSSHSKEHH